MNQKNIYYSGSFEESKKNLDSISATFCAAKWLQVSLHLTNGKTHSCYHPPTHSIDVNQLELNPGALHNTGQKFQERKMMLEGERPAGCEYCWKIEDAGHVSDRYYRSSEHWAKNKIIPISKLPNDYNVDPTYVEVNFNQSCNFKCAYCSPHLSSSWQEEIEEHGPYIFPDKEHNNIVRLKKQGLMPIEGSVKNNPYVTAFWKWLPTIYRNLRVFRMTGGEPLMDKNTFKVLEYVNLNPHGQLELSITTNLCPPDEKLFDKFLSLIKDCEKIRTYEDKNNFNDDSGNYCYVAPAYKHLMMFVSLDSVEHQAEYIRSGLNYNQLLINLQSFLNETDHTSISFINTFNILSISKLKQFLELILKLREEFGSRIQTEKILESPPSHGIDHPPIILKKFQRIWFDIPLLNSPAWLNCYNATDEQISELEDIYKWMEQHTDIVKFNQTFEGFKPFELEKLQRNINVIKENRSTQEQRYKNNRDFKIFFEEYDHRRNTDFVKTFPEMAEWYRNII